MNCITHGIRNCTNHLLKAWYSKDWNNKEMYVIYDRTYDQAAPSYICISCKVIEYYNRPHSDLYPHNGTCKYSKYNGTDTYLGYVIGPNVTQISADSKFHEVMRTRPTDFAGPYRNNQLNTLNC